VNKNDAMARAISDAEAADRLLGSSAEQQASAPAGHLGTAANGPNGGFEGQQAARYAAASAYAAAAQAWAAIAGELATHDEQLERARLERQRDDAERRSRSWDHG
jgi:hypothetical protein